MSGLRWLVSVDDHGEITRTLQNCRMPDDGVFGGQWRDVPEEYSDSLILAQPCVGIGEQGIE